MVRAIAEWTVLNGGLPSLWLAVGYMLSNEERRSLLYGMAEEVDRVARDLHNAIAYELDSLGDSTA